MQAIVNVTSNFGIGLRDRLLVSIPEDLRRFRALTTGRTVICGRRTLETFPGKKPLKNRRNLILSHDPTQSGGVFFRYVDYVNFAPLTYPQSAAAPAAPSEPRSPEAD